MPKLMVRSPLRTLHVIIPADQLLFESISFVAQRKYVGAKTGREQLRPFKRQDSTQLYLSTSHRINVLSMNFFYAKSDCFFAQLGKRCKNKFS